MVEVVAQKVGVALAADLGPRPGCHFLGIQRLGQQVVDADLQRLDQAMTLIRVNDGEDRQ
eukprot:gene59694-biopygen43098